MPFVREFEWGDDEEYGTTGWMLRDAPNFNAARGLGVAHDTLEHFPGKWHTLEDEMLAFGAIVYMRVEGGYYYRRSTFRTPAQILASDVFEFVVRNAQCEVKPCRTTKVTDSELEYLIPDLLAECSHLWESELDDEDRAVFTRKAFDTAMKHAMNWMRVGYRKAVKRWGRFPEHWAHVFGQLEEEVDEQHRQCDLGEVLRVSVNISEGTYTLTRYWPD